MPNVGTNGLIPWRAVAGGSSGLGGLVFIKLKSSSESTQTYRCRFMHYLSLFGQVGAAGREFGQVVGQVDWHLPAMTLGADTGVSAARRARPG